ncbi:MAG TPA: hypothetical protein DCG33_02805 [Prevotellaceae bacterium]|nr:hypothetical protein [Prevotellaceae bacterium]
MKHLMAIIALLLALTCCTTGSDRLRMRAGLDSINQCNRNDRPFTVAGVQPYVAFFDDHGTPNDRLLAHYLLGRAYHEHGEAPMALQCYHDAIDYADTTATDCDYAQLARVYGQMAQIFYEQGLYRQQLDFQRKAAEYAWIGKDTLAALMSYEQESQAYNNLNMPDSLLYICEHVSQLYRKYGYNNYAGQALGYILRTLINRQEFDKVREYMQIYESESEYFDSLGNIQNGREIYYRIKGLYYLHTNKFDSAEYYFRKELRDGKDFDNQHSGALGLSEIYQRREQTDSTAKYCMYAYAMLDSVYAKRSTKDVERIQAMYNYTRNQEIARRKSEEARQNMQMLSLTFILFVGFAFTVVILAYIYFRKRREGLFLYMQSLEELKQLKAEKAALCQHQEEFSQIILEKDKRIDYLEQRVSRYGKQVYFKTANAERCLRESPLYKVLEQKAIQGHSLDEDDWKKTDILIGEYLPSFDDFLATNLHRLKESERQIMILLRLHFKPVDIAGMTGLSKSQISQNCTEIMKKIFEIKGCSKELIAKLNKIF